MINTEQNTKTIRKTLSFSHQNNFKKLFKEEKK